MPDTNLPAGAAGKEQKQDVMFRWELLPRGAFMSTSSGKIVGEVIRAQYPDTFWRVRMVFGAYSITIRRAKTRKAGIRDVEDCWRAIARTAKALGLYEPKSGSVPCFAVKDSAGHDHVYETPAVDCWVRIASDGSLRDVVDLEGNPFEIRKVERS